MVKHYIRNLISIIVAFVFLELVGERINVAVIRLLLAILVCIITNFLIDAIYKKKKF